MACQDPTARGCQLSWLYDRSICSWFQVKLFRYSFLIKKYHGLVHSRCDGAFEAPLRSECSTRTTASLSSIAFIRVAETEAEITTTVPGLETCRQVSRLGAAHSSDQHLPGSAEAARATYRTLQCNMYVGSGRLCLGKRCRKIAARGPVVGCIESPEIQARGFGARVATHTDWPVKIPLAVTLKRMYIFYNGYLRF